ncbi:unnamed protein product, partial [Didymodactylos carnosus]
MSNTFQYPSNTNRSTRPTRSNNPNTNIGGDTRVPSTSPTRRTNVVGQHQTRNNNPYNGNMNFTTARRLSNTNLSNSPQRNRPTAYQNNSYENEEDKIAPNDCADTTTTSTNRQPLIGSGYLMFQPISTKRDKMIAQAEKEKQQYMEHVERNRLKNINEVHRLGGECISEAEAREKQAEKFRQEKIERQGKFRSAQQKKKEEEEKELETKKQEARLKTIANERKDKERQNELREKLNPQKEQFLNQVNTASKQVHSVPTQKKSNVKVESIPPAFPVWTDTERERDRKATMEQFLNRFSTTSLENEIQSKVKTENDEARFTENTDMDKYTTLSDDENDIDEINHKNDDRTMMDNLAQLVDMFPHENVETLRNYLVIYEGNLQAVSNHLLNP